MSPQGKKPLRLDIAVCMNYLKGKKGKNGLEIHAFPVSGFTDPKKRSQKCMSEGSQLNRLIESLIRPNRGLRLKNHTCVTFTR
jgi:hypothetical protein